MELKMSYLCVMGSMRSFAGGKDKQVLIVDEVQVEYSMFGLAQLCCAA